MKKILVVSLMALACVSGWGQTKTERISKELSFERKGPQNSLLISNINGSVTVEGYDGNAIQVEVEKIIQGKTEERVANGMKEIGMGIIDRADTIILYVSGVCSRFGRGFKHNRNHWGYDWDGCKDETSGYDYKLNFTIRVPKGTHIIASTINDGNIMVSKVSGQVHANNVNGGIILNDLTHAARAHTVNGDVDITYQQNPGAECRFYTLNGDINAYFRKGLSSIVNFKSFNGEFFTNLESLVAMPASVQKKKTEHGNKYEVNGNRYQTGNGGALLDFETFNGNVYLREK